MTLRRIVLAVMLAVVACETGPFAGGDVAEEVEGAAAAEIVGAVAGSERRPRADTAELTSRITTLVGSFVGGAAIWIADPGDRRPLYAREPDAQVIAASLYKLGVMLHVEDLVERREVRYADTITVEPEDVWEDGSLLFPGAEVTIDEALELMITQSDNGAALALWRTYGVEAINATLGRHRIPGFRIGAAGEDNVVTARAAGVILERIAKRRLVSKAASDRMLARLERQAVTGRADALLPDGARVAHKTGDLEGLAHDAAIVFTPAGPRVVVVLTWDAPEDAAHELIARVALAVYQTAR